jgi:hypothetical protein
VFVFLASDDSHWVTGEALRLPAVIAKAFAGMPRSFSHCTVKSKADLPPVLEFPTRYLAKMP